jgi:hypothetical protein
MEQAEQSVRYRYVPYGGGLEELDRLAVRDRIRAGDIEASTELSIVGNDQWHAAASFPELARYFELLAVSSNSRPGFAVAPPKVRDVRPMSERVTQGLLYPVAGGQVLTILALALCSMLPVLWLLATLAAPAMMLDVIRKSASGKTRMPAFVDTTNIPELFGHYLKVLFVTLVAVGPLIAVGFWAIIGLLTHAVTPAVAVAAVVLAAAVGAIYYPACLATVAVWDSALDALNPVYVIKVISTIGGDYFAVIAVWFCATMLSTFMRFSPMARIPIIGSLFFAFLSYFILFYASHLLGYAVFRHEHALGWE